MATIEEAEDELVKPPTLKECRHCAQEIKVAAKVCRYCSRVQAGFFRFSNFIRIPEGMSFLVSVGLLAVAFLNLSAARDARSRAQEALDKVAASDVQAKEANTKAEASLTRATATETRVRPSRRF